MYANVMRYDEHVNVNMQSHCNRIAMQCNARMCVCVCMKGGSTPQPSQKNHFFRGKFCERFGRRNAVA